MTKWVYRFGAGSAEGGATMRELLGGKGANLAEMSNIGLPVPPGFTITTEVCGHYYDHGKAYPEDLREQVAAALAAVEDEVGMRLGDASNPLLVSVRSGSRASMPGMMDTVLNLGLNRETVEGLARRSGDARFAYDSYRRFIQMYGDVVMGVEHYLFEELLDELKEDRDARLDTDLDAGALEELVAAYEKLVAEELGQPFPSDVQDQIWGAVGAVFGSWMNTRAVTYRRLHDIPAGWGTAVNIQAMVFGNMGADCATGVAFTRNPSTGVPEAYGEFLVNAQGEDVVAGIRTPQPLTIAAKDSSNNTKPAMEEVMPEAFAGLLAIQGKLETHFKDMQDIEFTVQQGRLWMLQTRAGKRTAGAALRIAVDMVREGSIDREEAIRRLDPASLDQLLHPRLDPDSERHVLTRGLPASPGAASGAVVFDADEALSRSGRGEDVILARTETSPEDIHGMHAARGILTARGGMTSHAAVVARGMGRPCVAGAGEVRIDYIDRRMTILGTAIAEGSRITIDGSTGEVMLGEVAMIEPALTGDFATVMEWADEIRRLGVRANADLPGDAATALKFGAEGIGLCRTEHMFFEGDRIVAMRQMIVAEDEDGRRRALEKIGPMQRGDFVELFKTMAGRPVTIRLLDPPLHEFLPGRDDEIEEVARAAGVEPAGIRRRSARLHESNPMLGHRGCRLGITYPEIYEMQARAIFEAAVEAGREMGVKVVPEVMVPLIATSGELAILKPAIDRVAAAVAAETGAEVEYLVGTMIELPRAVLRAGDIAENAAFFSFGTNDLTQTTYGLSRDDAGAFLDEYRDRGIVEQDPFVSIDIEGVGELVRMAVERGRAARPDIKLGICGEHGGDPASVRFFDAVGLDYVSCSPYRVPVARLAAAQATLAAKDAERDESA